MIQGASAAQGWGARGGNGRVSARARARLCVPGGERRPRPPHAPARAARAPATEHALLWAARASSRGQRTRRWAAGGRRWEPAPRGGARSSVAVCACSRAACSACAAAQQYHTSNGTCRAGCAVRAALLLGELCARARAHSSARALANGTPGPVALPRAGARTFALKSLNNPVAAARGAQRARGCGVCGRDDYAAARAGLPGRLGSPAGPRGVRTRF